MSMFTGRLAELRGALASLGIRSGYLGRFPFASLPAPTAARASCFAYCTDIGAAGCWVCVNNAGNRWIPMRGEAQFAWLAADSAHAATTGLSIDLQGRFPAGAIQPGDQFEVWGQGVKSGTTDSFRSSLLVGSAGTTADTAVFSDQTPMAAANVSGAILYSITLSNPSGTPKGQRNGSSNATAGFMTLNNSSAQAAAVTLAASPFTNATYISFASKGGATVDTCTVQAGTRMIWRTPQA